MMKSKPAHRKPGELGLYEIQAYLGALSSPTYGGWQGTATMMRLLGIRDLHRPRILDAGCATGYVTRLLATAFECEVVGVDKSEILLQMAEERARKERIRNSIYVQASVEALPFPDNSFDIVIAEAVTALVQKPEEALLEYFRVLKPDGRVGTLDLYMTETLQSHEITNMNRVMTHVTGSNVKMRTMEEWRGIMGLIPFSRMDYHEFDNPFFVKEVSRVERINLIVRLLFLMAMNRTVRRQVLPVLTHARAFKQQIREKKYRYFIFIGEKQA